MGTTTTFYYAIHYIGHQKHHTLNHQSFTSTTYLQQRRDNANGNKYQLEKTKCKCMDATKTNNLQENKNQIEYEYQIREQILIVRKRSG